MKSTHYPKVWKIVNGVVRSAFKAHPDYLTKKGKHSALDSIVKRVTGEICVYMERSMENRDSDPG